MEINQEIIEKYGLQGNVDGLIKEVVEPHYSKKSNEDTELIIDGAVKPISELTGLKREKGEKGYKFIERATNHHVKTQLEKEKTNIETLEKELKAKLDNNNDDLTKKQIKDLEDKLDATQKQLVDLEALKPKAEGYDKIEGELTGLKLKIAFGNSLPKFNESVDKDILPIYINKVKGEILEKYTIELEDDGETAIAVDKENIHKRVKLADLLLKDAKIKQWSDNDSSRGLGANGGGKSKSIQGLEVDILESDDTATAQQKIKDYLTGTKKLDPIRSPEYSKEYLRLYKAFNEKRTSR